MMVKQRTILLLTFIVTLFNNCSSLFYTNSRENDFPRFGKRFFQLTNPPQTGVKEWYHPSNIRDDNNYWKHDTSMNLNSYAWRPILASIEAPDKLRNDVFPSLRDEELAKMGMWLKEAKRLVYPDLKDLLIQTLKRRDRSLDEIYLSPTK